MAAVVTLPTLARALGCHSLSGASDLGPEVWPVQPGLNLGLTLALHPYILLHSTHGHLNALQIQQAQRDHSESLYLPSQASNFRVLLLPPPTQTVLPVSSLF